MGFDKHAEFLNFSIINLPKYEAILGKPWLGRWNPIIDWQKNTMVWKMGRRTIAISGVQNPQPESRIDFKFVSEKLYSRNNLSTTNEKIGQERASISCGGPNNK